MTNPVKRRTNHPVQQLLALLDQLDEMVLVTNRAGRLVYISAAARQLLGAKEDTADAHLGRWLIMLADVADDRIEQMLDDFAMIPGNRRQEATITMRRDDGSTLPVGVAVCKTMLYDESVYVWLLRDHSRLKHAETQLLDAQRLVRSILQNTSEGYVLVDAGGMVIDTNPAFETMCGLNAMDLRESRLDSLFSGRGRRAVHGLLERLSKGRAASAEVVFHRADGREAIGYFKGAPLFDASDEQVGLFGLVTDITEAKAKERKIEKLAYYDPLTDLANRTLLHEKLEQAILLSQRTQQKFALLFFDLDRFKYVNDTFNHPIGDQLLKQVAERIRGAVRRSDVVARFGGDEFVVGRDASRTPHWWQKSCWMPSPSRLGWRSTP
jgi:PAS domain S-box-containing protein